MWVNQTDWRILNEETQDGMKPRGPSAVKSWFLHTVEGHRAEREAYMGELD